jgi:hypothetical protein
VLSGLIDSLDTDVGRVRHLAMLSGLVL